MKNNLLNKYLFSCYVAAALFVGGASVATFFAGKEIKMIKANPENQAVVDSCKSTFFLCACIIIASLMLAHFSGITYPKNVREKANTFTKHYLQDIFVRYPETRRFSFILENPKKLQEIAAVICNNLTENEQKEILNIVEKELNDSNTKNQSVKSRKIENAITNIVQKHATRDPEYMNKILSAIMSAQKPNIIETAQKVR